MYDRRAFRSGLLRTSHFNERFSDDNLAFWIPRLIEAARISGDHEVLDVGCGTGGFTLAIATETSATVTGIDEAENFLAFAAGQATRADATARFMPATAEALPFESESYDRVLLSLVLHQLEEPSLAVREAFRVLRRAGVVVVRSIAPEDAVNRVPERFLPSMAAADAKRLPSIDLLCDWLRDAGFEALSVERHTRNKMLEIEQEIASLRAEVAGRYTFVSNLELEEGVRRMRAEAERSGQTWVDPRPTYIITGVKPTGGEFAAQS